MKGIIACLIVIFFVGCVAPKNYYDINSRFRCSSTIICEEGEPLRLKDGALYFKKYNGYDCATECDFYPSVTAGTLRVIGDGGYIEIESDSMRLVRDGINIPLKPTRKDKEWGQIVVINLNSGTFSPWSQVIEPVNKKDRELMYLPLLTSQCDGVSCYQIKLETSPDIKMSPNLTIVYNWYDDMNIFKMLLFWRYFVTP